MQKSGLRQLQRNDTISAESLFLLLLLGGVERGSARRVPCSVHSPFTSLCFFPSTCESHKIADLTGILQRTQYSCPALLYLSNVKVTSNAQWRNVPKLIAPQQRKVCGQLSGRNLSAYDLSVIFSYKRIFCQWRSDLLFRFSLIFHQTDVPLARHFEIDV